MKKLILTSLCVLMGMSFASAQKVHRNVTNLKKEIMEVAHRTNNYFMAKYSDPTLDTFVKRVRTSNLWTRAVYYEGLMALYEIDPQQKYLDYTDRWADYHKWQARSGETNDNADNQCCMQVYIDRYVQSGGKKDLSHVKPRPSDCIQPCFLLDMDRCHTDGYAYICKICKSQRREKVSRLCHELLQVDT